MVRGSLIRTRTRTITARYETEVLARCKYASYVGDLRFHVREPEEKDEVEGPVMVQQSMVEGELVAGEAMQRGLVCWE